jgi:cytochrome c553
MRYFTILACAVFLFLTGCEKKEEQQQAPKKIEQTAKTPSIKVTQSGTIIEKENPFERYDIEGRRQVRVSPDGIETPVTRQIGAMVSVKNQYEELNAKLLAQRLSKNYMLKCSACHDDYANGVVGPSLLTKTSDEIYDMIEAYRHDTEVNVLMKYLVMQMDEEEIRTLANEIAEFNQEIRESR